jgi:hypothetical protein
MEGQKGCFARRQFDIGEVIFDEHPLITAKQVNLYSLADCLTAFFALSESLRAEVLSLYAAPTLNLPTEGETARFVESARVVELLRENGCNVPSGEEAAAARFLLVWDSNCFSFRTEGALFLSLRQPFLRSQLRSLRARRWLSTRCAAPNFAGRGAVL